MKKRFKVLIFTSLFSLSSVIYAQAGLLNVLDIPNLLQAIESTYAYYQEIQNTIEQVKNSYEQIKMAAEQVKSVDWNAVGEKLGKNFEEGNFKDNPFEVITAVHTSANDIMSAVDKQMNTVNNVQAQLRKKSISFGGMDVSVADLCGAGDKDKDFVHFMGNAAIHTDKSARKLAKGYVEGLSYDEKRAIMQKFGMSPENYATMAYSKMLLNNIIVESNLRSTEDGITELVKEIVNDQNVINSLNQQIGNNGQASLAAATQVTNSSLAILVKDMGHLWQSSERLCGIISQKITAEQAYEYLTNELQMYHESNYKKNTTSSSGVTNPLFK